MSLNTDFAVEKAKIEWQGQQVAEVRGLTPNDVMKIISENPADMDELFATLENEVKKSIDTDAPLTPDQIAARLQDGASNSFGKLIMRLPGLIAKLIAVACDSPDQWEAVRDRFVVPLQFEIVQEIARLTFIDPPGFKRFVGNALALVSGFKGDQRPVQVSSDG